MTQPIDLIDYEDDLVAQGIRENPPGSNRTIIGEKFGWNGVPWCAETQSVATFEVFGEIIFWSASVAQWIDAAKAGIGWMEWVDRNDTIEDAMLVTYDFGLRGNPANFHIAMIRDSGTQAKFQTDGGNEQDAMRQQWRDRKYVQGFIRLPFDSSNPIPTPSPIVEVSEVSSSIITKDGTLWQVGRGMENQAWVTSQSPAYFGKWTAPFTLGGTFIGGLDILEHPNGSLRVSGVGTNNLLYEKWRNPKGVWEAEWKQGVPGKWK